MLEEFGGRLAEMDHLGARLQIGNALHLLGQIHVLPHGHHDLIQAAPGEDQVVSQTFAQMLTDYCGGCR